MHWGLVLCLPLGEVLQCLVINLEILVQISFHDLLYTYMYASNCIMYMYEKYYLFFHGQYYIKLLFTLLEPLRTRLMGMCVGNVLLC